MDYSCLLFEENRPSGCEETKNEEGFLVKRSFWRRTTLFTANLRCADLEHALEQEVVASLPSKSCLPMILYDVFLLTHPMPFYDAETLLDISSKSASGI